MKTWPVQDAKARFNELLDACISEGPQMVSRGKEAAVLVPIAEWRRLQSAANRSLKSLLLIDEARANLLLPKRRSFIEALKTMPDAGEDSDFDRHQRD